MTAASSELMHAGLYVTVVCSTLALVGALSFTYAINVYGRQIQHECRLQLDEVNRLSESAWSDLRWARHHLRLDGHGLAKRESLYRNVMFEPVHMVDWMADVRYDMHQTQPQHYPQPVDRFQDPKSDAGKTLLDDVNYAKSRLASGGRATPTIGLREEPAGQCSCQTQSMFCPAGNRGPPGPMGQSGTPGPPGQPGLTGRIGSLPNAPFSWSEPSAECRVCPPGPPGPTGYRGIAGTQGPPGTKGSPGTPGNDGRPGTYGLQGTPGVYGESGKPGVRGRAGRPGTLGGKGEPGKAGVDGQRGRSGRPGQNGNDGYDGLEGETGPIGPDGEPGDGGTDGTDGQVGVPGPDGRDGGYCRTCEQVNSQQANSRPLRDRTE